jgi:hypothetical protein
VTIFLRQLQATPAPSARTQATSFVTPSGTLQSTLSSASAGTDGGRLVAPHHPITCSLGELRYEDDGSFSCDHAVVEPHDPRTQACVVHSIALLIIELATEL